MRPAVLVRVWYGLIACITATALFPGDVARLQAQRSTNGVPRPGRGADTVQGGQAPTAAAYNEYAEQVETMLRHDVLDPWYPRAVDRDHGGFHAEYDRHWNALPSQGKLSVFESRMVWTAATVAEKRPDLRAQYLAYVEHGTKYLRDVLWDKKYGGFYWGLADDGTVSPRFGDRKQMYGISFCLYGLAASYRVTHDAETLRLAQATFRWADKHAHDSENGGYYEWLTREGTPLRPEPYAAVVEQPSTAGGFPVGFKSMNTHIHLLESMTELYKVWPDPLVRQRVLELLQIVRDRIAVEPGVMNLYFTPAWRPVPDHDSYGHDVETTYLLREASEVIHAPGAEKTARVGRMMVDHALAYGWDAAKGGLYQAGAFAGKPEDLHKEWWVQMENLNTLLLMHELYGRQTGVYWQAFQTQWRFIRTFQVDPESPGEYSLLNPDGRPATTNKGSAWKASYHEARALMNVTERLRRLANDRSAPTTHP